MKVWFEFHNNWLMEDVQLYFGVSGYRHKRKEWKGFTIYFSLYKWMISLNYVNNFSEYKRIVIDREPMKKYLERIKNAGSGKKTSS